MLTLDFRTPVCRPNPGGQAAFAADWEHRYVALEGGWGSGKTWIGARKLVTLHLFNAVDREGRLTGVSSAAVAPTFPNARDFVVPELIRALDESGVRWEWKAVAHEFHLPDLSLPHRASRILVRTAERPETITGWEVGAAWADEPTRWRGALGATDPKLDPFLQLCARVRDPRARVLQLLCTYTNEGDCTGVYRRFHSGLPGHALYRARTAENPWQREWEREQRKILTPELARQYLDGEAISMRGQAVYPHFNPEVHVREDLEIDTARPLDLALDFNIAPGMHAEVGQWFEDRDEFTVVHEVYGPRLDVVGALRQLKAWVEERFGDFPFPVLHVYGDATGSAEWAATGESCYLLVEECLHEFGWPFRLRVPKSNPPVVDRINAFNCALQDAQGQVHWHCSPQCERLIADLRDLRRDTNGEIDRRDLRLSHASSAEGYRVTYLRPVRRLRLEATGGRFLV